MTVKTSKNGRIVSTNKGLVKNVSTMDKLEKGYI